MSDQPRMECISQPSYEPHQNSYAAETSNFAVAASTSCRRSTAVNRHAFTTPFAPEPVMSSESSFPAADSSAAPLNNSGPSNTNLPPPPPLNTANLSLLSAAASQRAAALPQRPSALTHSSSNNNSNTTASSFPAADNSGSTASTSSSSSRSSGLKRPSSFLSKSTAPDSDSPLEKKIIEAKKRSLTLDFTSPESAKKTLQTPDVLRFLQLTSPELEKFLTQGVAVVTTPTPTQFLFPKNVTAQQEQYARGFIDALNQLHQVHGFVPPGNLLSPGFVVTPGVNKNSLVGDKAGSNGASVSGIPDVATSCAAAAAAALAVSSHLQSPTRPESSLASVIMQTVAFPGSMTSQQLFSGAGTVAASMALLNQSLKLDQAKTHILAEIADRPPSQSAPPGTMEFTNLTQAPNSISSAVSTSSGPNNNRNQDNASVMMNNNQSHLHQHPASLAAVAGITNSVIPSAIVPSSAAAAGLLIGGRLEAALQHHQIQQQQQHNASLPNNHLPTTSHFLEVNPGSNHPNISNTGSPSPRSLIGTNSPAPSSNNPSPYPSSHLPHSRAGSSAGFRNIHGIKQESSSISDSGFYLGGSNPNSLDTDGFSGRSLASGSSGGSILDMDTQDEKKLERKRARNRLAATKCRKRKMERIDELETELKKKNKDNEDAAEYLQKLRNEVNSLNEMVQKHKTHGCNLPELPAAASSSKQGISRN